jgi:hypothetical protein
MEGRKEGRKQNGDKYKITKITVLSDKIKLLNRKD